MHRWPAGKEGNPWGIRAKKTAGGAGAGAQRGAARLGLQGIQGSWTSEGEQAEPRSRLKPVLLTGHLHGAKEAQGWKKKQVQPVLGLGERAKNPTTHSISEQGCLYLAAGGGPLENPWLRGELPLVVAVLGPSWRSKPTLPGRGHPTPDSQGPH